MECGTVETKKGRLLCGDDEHLEGHLEDARDGDGDVGVLLAIVMEGK